MSGGFNIHPDDQQRIHAFLREEQADRRSRMETLPTPTIEYTYHFLDDGPTATDRLDGHRYRLQYATVTEFGGQDEPECEIHGKRITKTGEYDKRASGTHRVYREELERHILALHKARKDKPIVLVVEQVDDDFVFFQHGDVEIWDASNYPATRYAKDDVKGGTYDTFVADTRQKADEAEARGATEIAQVLRSLADKFIKEHGT